MSGILELNYASPRGKRVERRPLPNGLVVACVMMALGLVLVLARAEWLNWQVGDILSNRTTASWYDGRIVTEEQWRRAHAWRNRFSFKDEGLTLEQQAQMQRELKRNRRINQLAFILGTAGWVAIAMVPLLLLSSIGLALCARRRRHYLIALTSAVIALAAGWNMYARDWPSYLGD